MYQSVATSSAHSYQADSQNGLYADFAVEAYWAPRTHDLFNSRAAAIRCGFFAKASLDHVLNLRAPACS